VAEEPKYDEDIMKMTPGERIEMVWELTKKEWALKEPGWQESGMRRDVIRVIRPK
jgi:uncharacterized cupredoxin-like copper-binding protein